MATPTETRRDQRAKRRQQRREMPYVAGRRPSKALIYLATAMIGGGAAFTVLWILPSLLDDVSGNGEWGEWVRKAGAQLAAPYLVLLGFFIAFLVVWQLENSLRDDRRDPASASLSHRAAVGVIALLFVGPITLFLIVWAHLGAWAPPSGMTVNAGEVVVATVAALFVVYLSCEVAAAPPPNALVQLPRWLRRSNAMSG